MAFWTRRTGFWSYFGGANFVAEILSNNPSKHDLETFYRFGWSLVHYQVLVHISIGRMTYLISVYLFTYTYMIYIITKNMGGNLKKTNMFEFGSILIYSKACFGWCQWCWTSAGPRPSYGPLVMWPWVRGQGLIGFQMVVPLGWGPLNNQPHVHLRKSGYVLGISPMTGKRNWNFPLLCFFVFFHLFFLQTGSCAHSQVINDSYM